MKNIQWNYGEMFCPNGEPVIGRDLKPIPLTPGILEKNGFVFNNEYFPEVWTSKDSRVILTQEGTSWKTWYIHIYSEDFSTIGDVECDYVHELQHVLRLCGLNDLADNFKI